MPPYLVGFLRARLFITGTLGPPCGSLRHWLCYILVRSSFLQPLWIKGVFHVLIQYVIYIRLFYTLVFIFVFLCQESRNDRIKPCDACYIRFVTLWHSSRLIPRVGVPNAFLGTQTVSCCLPLQQQKTF